MQLGIKSGGVGCNVGVYCMLIIRNSLCTVFFFSCICAWILFVRLQILSPFQLCTLVCEFYSQDFKS